MNLKSYSYPLFIALPIFIQSFFSEPYHPTSFFPTELTEWIEQKHPLPMYVERGYSPLGRSPVTDAVLGDPWYLPQYVNSVTENIKQIDKSIFQMVSLCLKAGGMPQTEENHSFTPYSKQVPKEFFETFGDDTGQTLYCLWRTFVQIYKETEFLYSVLSQNEKDWIVQNHESFLFGSNQNGEYDFLTSDSLYPFQFFEFASKINFPRLSQCLKNLTWIVDFIYQHRNEFSTTQLKEDFIWKEQGLKFVISSKSHTTHEEQADFFLDLGSENKIKNSAGGTLGTRSAALHISLNGGHSFEGTKFTQGAGILGLGLLANFGGHNFYKAHSYSQGSAFMGMGLLIDYEGLNQYELGFAGQSCAIFGTSLLWNRGGQNDYIAHEGMAQAASSTMGIAFLLEQEGHSQFICGSSGKGIMRSNGIGQGASIGFRFDPWRGHPSLYGGVSFLYNGGGNNTYKNFWFGQGSAYFLSTGILVDEGGYGHFSSEVDSQGQGLHLAAGLLLEKGPSSTFSGGWGSLGVGADRSVGFFINGGSHNVYKGLDLTVGTSRKPKGLGVFIALQGGNQYSFKKLSNANIQYPQSPLEWSKAFFMNMGETNSYPEHVDSMVRGSNKKWGIAGHSVGIDIQMMKGPALHKLFQLFPKSPRVPFPFDPIHSWSTNTAFYPLELASNKAALKKQIEKISASNYDERRYLYECIDLYRFKHADEQMDLSLLLENPQKVSEDQFNYAALWALQNDSKTHLEKVIQALREGSIPSAYSRKIAIELVGKNKAAIHALNNSLLNDEEEENRAEAAYYLAHIASEGDLKLLEPALNSPSESVRYKVALGLRDTSLRQVLPLVQPLFEDSSFYVRRAAAFVAISLHDKNGIPILLETLQYPTLDTTDNYGDNLYNELAKYVGVNLGVNKEAWIKWWQEKKDTFVFPQCKVVD